MDVDTLKWSVRESYPFSKRIYGARSIFHKELFLVFGGGDGDYSFPEITGFNSRTNVWSIVGKMNSARRFTSVIERNGEYLVVGGEKVYPYKHSEKCSFY